MRPAKHSYNFNPPVQAGKFLEGALVGRPRKLEMKADQVSDMREMRGWLKRNIRSVMDEIRTKQADDPAMPKHPFAKNLMMDIEGELEDYADGDDRYEVRIQSAVDTVLDYAGGVDFWAELVDRETGRVIADYKVDITSNAAKKDRKPRLADMIYFFDNSIEESPDKNEVYRQPEYQEMVQAAVSRFKTAIALQKPN
jgi:hypothetical protein